MKHSFEQKVYYSDTDAYGVVWHGSYLRWLEMGRVEYCEALGLNLLDLIERDIVLPVINMNIRYKASGKLNDVVIIETSVSKATPVTVVFEQTIRNKESGKLFLRAEFEVAAIHNDGGLYRRMPDILKTAFEKNLEIPQYSKTAAVR